MKLRDWPIKRKLVGIILLSIACVLLLISVPLLLFELHAYRQTTTRGLYTVGDIIAENSTAALMFEDAKLARENLAALRVEPEIVAAALYNKTNRLYAWFPTNAATTAFPPLPGRDGIHWTPTRVILYEPVVQGDDRVGTLYLEQDLTGMYRRFAVYGGVLLAVMIGAGVVSLLFSNLVQRGLSEPILDLANAARTISETKDYTVRPRKRANDELGNLTDTFNEMLEEIQHSERALRESEARFRTLSEAVPTIVGVSGVDGRNEYLNSRWYEYTGLTREQSREFGWLAAVHPDDRVRVEAERGRSFASGQPLETTLRYRRHDGVFRWHLMRAVPLLDADGKVLKWFGTATDIETQKQTEQALEDAQTQLQQHAAELEGHVAERTAKLTETIGELESFSYSISHDMRAPLRAMQGYADIVLETYGKQLGPDGGHYLERIVRGSRRLDSLIQDILTYSRIARAEIELHPVDLQRLVEDIVQQYEGFQPPNAGLCVEKPLLAVKGHEASLTQVITNLLANAVKFVPPGERPVVRVWTERVGGRVRFNVSDRGIGIAPEHIDRIFAIFERVHAHKAYEGTGIGLSIVRKAVERMGGRVGVDSQLGKGSIFWFELPPG